MGLDQYAFLREKDGTEVEFYWRKHARLQTFMEYIWTSRGNFGVFNCKELQLNKNDIINLKKSVDNSIDGFPCSGGFFWGSESQIEITKDSKSYDLEFADKAIKCIDRGGTVIYDSWW